VRLIDKNIILKKKQEHF